MKTIKNKSRINFEKINEIRLTTRFLERWNSDLKPRDFIELRTFEDRIYKSKFEFWNERRKDMGDMFACTHKFLYPPLISDILNSVAQAVIHPLSILSIPTAYSSLEYFKEKNGYVQKEDS